MTLNRCSRKPQKTLIAYYVSTGLEPMRKIEDRVSVPMASASVNVARHVVVLKMCWRTNFQRKDTRGKNCNKLNNLSVCYQKSIIAVSFENLSKEKKVRLRK